MGVYDMVRATIDCPYCEKDSTIVEQINKGSYAMKSFYIGDKLPLEPYYGDDIWKYDISCSECSQVYKVNFYINHARFTKAVVFDYNWIKQESYFKNGKASKRKTKNSVGTD